MRFSGYVLIAGGILAWDVADVSAQHRHMHNHGNSRRPSYHIDHHDHVVRDSHGHVIGTYHHDVLHDDSSYIVPHGSSTHHGTYHYRSGRYYYAPNTFDGRQSREVAVEYGGFGHVDDLAARLEQQANEFCLDLHYNYSHNQGFKETYREAYSIMQIAEFIHEAEHEGDRRAIREKLAGIDQLLHHVQEDVRGWSRHQHQQVGQLGILSKLDLMESTIHHLMNDVGVAPTPEPGNERAPAPDGDLRRAPEPLKTAPPPF